MTLTISNETGILGQMLKHLNVGNDI